MSALNPFLSTWQNARTTFGEGTPQGGESIDQSARLRAVQSEIEGASPRDWTGSAADTYADANQRQAHALGAMADIDYRLRAEVDRSAEVVAAGRRDLDAVRQWVVDAAATVPPTALGDQMLYPVISKGAGEVADIVQRSNSELNAIAERIQKLGGEYDTLAPAESESDAEPVSFMGDEEEPESPETTLDLADIVQLAPYDPSDPSTFGPPGYRELVPGSGTWVPDPGNPHYQPTPVEAPLDLDDVVYRPPYVPGDESTYGPYGYMELVPNSGVWVPDPKGPMWPQDPPQTPVDLTDIEYRPPFVSADESTYGPYGYTELIPGGGVWVPDPDAGPYR